MRVESIIVYPVLSPRRACRMNNVRKLVKPAWYGCVPEPVIGPHGRVVRGRHGLNQAAVDTSMRGFGRGACFRYTENGKFPDIAPGLSYDSEVLGGDFHRRVWVTGRSVLEGDNVLLPLGPPLPPDAVVAKRGESGMLGGLSVPLTWGVAVPPDDYDHWAPHPGADIGVDVVAAEATNSEAAAGIDEWGEWTEWNEWTAENAEPRFEVPRSRGVIPHSPAAG